MEVVEMLDNLKEKARKDPALREELLATREEKEPLAAMKRSTNGGGENSPMLEGEDDFYELFFAGL